MRALLLLILFVANSFAATRIKDLTTIFGTGTSNNVLLQANLGGANNPTIRYNSTEAKWQRSDDGISFSDIGSGSSDEFNILLNTTFEKATYDESWTTTGSTSTRSKETSILLPGKTGAFKSVASSQNLVLYQDSTTAAAQLAGLQGYVSAWVYNSAPSVTICARAAGVTLSGNNCLTLATDSLYKQYVIPVVLSATSNGVYISGTGITGTTIVGKVTVGLLPDMMPEVSQAQLAGSSYFNGTASCTWSRTSTTLGAFTTTAACPGPTIQEQNIGSWQTTDSDLPRQTVNNLPPGKYKATFIVITGTGTLSSNSSFAITDGTTTCQETGVTGEVRGENTILSCVFNYTGVSNGVFELQSRASSGSTSIFNDTGTGYKRSSQFFLEYYPPSSKVYSQNSSDTDWVSCGLTTSDFTGMGTVSSIEDRCMRDGSDLLVRLKFTSGTSTAVEARVNLKLGGVALTSASSSVIPSISYVGEAGVSTSSTTFFSDSVLIEPSVAYMTFGLQSSTANKLTKATGSAAIGTSATVSIYARIPVNGWVKNQITGSFANVVTTAGVSKPTLVSAAIDASEAITENDSSFITSCTNADPSVCTVTSSFFVADPKCWAEPTSAGTISAVTADTTTSITVDRTDTATPFKLFCHGSR
jgi:hypothetical protein